MAQPFPFHAMALAASPLQCPSHMGEVTPHSTVIVALPDLRSSIESNGANSEENVTPASLGPLNSRLPNNIANSSVSGEAAGPSISDGGGETCPGMRPAKGDVSVSFASDMPKEALSIESEVAVREENEDNTKEEGCRSQDQRQSPSPSASFQGTNKPKPLASALKTSSLLSPTKNGRTKRRVRGLWGDDSQFSQLHDETLMSVMRFFSMKDLCIVSMVCQRWKNIALHPDFWKRIEASDFVEAAYDHYSSSETASGRPSASKSTSLELADRLERHSPQSLVIHSIQHRLSADNFSSSLPSLQELTLTSFDELTDTHVHVLLLSSSCKNVQARSKRSCILKRLVLEHCPHLTDTAVQSIGKMCLELEELSLKGCRNITDPKPLKELWNLVKKPVTLSAPPAARAPPPLSAMAMLFSPPPPPAPAPLPPRPSTPTSTLQSLFAPPGNSPPRTADVVSFLPRSLSNGSTTNEPGQLKSINLSNTGVTAKSLLAAWKMVPPGNSICLRHLLLDGNGDSWNDSFLLEMASMLDLSKLRTLNLGCSLPSSKVTDKGLQNLVSRGESVSKGLRNLDLSGHTALTGTGLGELIKAVAPTLEELVLDGCKGISSKSFNAARDFANCDALAKAILNCTTRKANKKVWDEKSEHGRGLRRLSLSCSFSNKAQLQKNKNLQMHEETLGNFLLEAIGQQPKTKKKPKATAGLPSCCSSTTVGTLEELDLTNCWFVTSADITSLRKRCPRLHRIHFAGTRADV